MGNPHQCCEVKITNTDYTIILNKKQRYVPLTGLAKFCILYTDFIYNFCTNNTYMISRFFGDIEPFLHSNKVLVIYGPRRVGKTTLLNQYLSKTKLKYRLDSGDNIRVQEVLSSHDFKAIKEYAAGYELIAIDEAQQITGIGLGLKILVDQVPNLKVIVTGSSSFDLANQVGEPLTGRKTTLTLFPIAELELAKEHNAYDLKQRLEDRLLFGSYPEVLTANFRESKIAVVEEIVNSYLFKDVLALDKIKKSKILVDLVKLLALQVGSEVSINEIATNLSINARTVERYIDILEKSFVILGVGSLRRNLRNEVRGKKKYYFYDTGVRNGIISQFNSLSERSDVGNLWENYLFIERLKKRSYQNIHANHYFWRTYEQQEIDYIEEREGKLFAYEFKWKETNVKAPARFLDNYPNALFNVITKENYLEFVV